MASIQERRDKTGKLISYQIKVSRGRDVLTGKQLTPYNLTWKPPETWEAWSKRTQNKELERVKAEFEAACKRGEIQTKEERREQAVKESKEPTFSDYAERYIARISAEKAISTQVLYKSYLDRACEQLGHYKIKDVTPLIVKTYISHLQTDTSLSHGTLVLWYRILHAFFEAAIDDEIIQFNPMQRMRLPKPRHDEKLKERTAYSASQVKYIFDCLEYEPLMWKAWVYFALDSGCRNGEVCGLKWSDINFETGEVTISRNAQCTTGKGIYVTTPKSKKTRTIIINPQALAVMKQWRAEQRAHFFKMGMKNTEDWCFTQQIKGVMINPHQPRDFLLKFGKKYGLEGLHPHALRHTMATLAIANGADVVSVSRKLGHATPTITLNVYAHENEAAQRKMNETYAATIYQDSNEA